MKKIKIAKLIEAIDLQSKEYPNYFNLLTYKIEFLITELDKNCTWAKDLKTLNEIEYNENYLLIPTQYDFHEHQVMVEFSKKQPFEIKNQLLDGLYKKGAFKNFKKLIDKFSITSLWYTFRTEKLIELAVKWCQNNNIDYEL